MVRPLRLTADWALPIDAPPIRQAAVLIDAGGKLAGVGPEASIPAPPDAETLDLGAAILLPGLVNTHTHLELTGFESQAPGLPGAPPGFREWIQAIRSGKEARKEDQFLEAARRGVRDCWAGGVTTFADTGDSGSVIQALAELGGSGIAFQEVFGPHPDQLEVSLQGLTKQVGRLAAYATGRSRLGISPHAPYTVSGPLYSKTALWARAHGLPIAVHLAESKEESEFVTRCAGPFAEAWKARGLPLLDHPSHGSSGAKPQSPTPTPRSPVEWLDLHGVLGPDTLCIHAVQLSAEDIDLLARRSVAIAHCPISNARHGHGAAPLAALREAGIRVGLGSDSVASVGALDLFAEARAARALGGLSAADALALGTLEGARAIGLEREIGSLTPGKWGDVVAVAGGGSAGRHASPEDAALAATPGSVLLTVLGGRVVHRAPAVRA